VVVAQARVSSRAWIIRSRISAPSRTRLRSTGSATRREAHFAREDLGAEKTGLSYHVVKAGKRQGFAHRHAKDEEIYVVLSGTGRLHLDDDVVELKPLDAIRIAPQVLRALEAGDTNLEVLAFGTHHEDDAEIVQGS
jgi:mannose-6-phosphate isomerase-like protein (cupin superfamily)